jgi:putative protein kinase ArgK-like GTPase of G3E family
VATRGDGVEDLLDAVEAFQERADESGLLARKRRGQMRRLLEEAVRGRVMGRVYERVLTPSDMEGTLDRLVARTTDPFTVASEVLARVGL